jgi:hypothetical protein
MSQLSDSKAEEKKDTSDASVHSAMATSIADTLTEPAGRSRDRSGSKVVGVACTSYWVGGCSGGDHWLYDRVDTSRLGQDGRNVIVSGGLARGGEV